MLCVLFCCPVIEDAECAVDDNFLCFEYLAKLRLLSFRQAVLKDT